MCILGGSFVGPKLRSRNAGPGFEALRWPFRTAVHPWSMKGPRHWPAREPVTAFHFCPNSCLLSEFSFPRNWGAVSPVLGSPSVFCILPVCVLCPFSHQETPLFIFDVYELKMSWILTVCLLCVLQIFFHCYLSLAVFFLSCTNVSFSDCKSIMWFFSIENLENTKKKKKHKVKEINVAKHLTWRRMLPALHCVLLSLSCASAALFFKTILGHLSHRWFCMPIFFT